MSRVVNLRDFPGKGFARILPPDVVWVARPSRWGNPWKIGEPDPVTREPMDRDRVLELYRGWITFHLDGVPEHYRAPLVGMRYGCWCAPLPCHADILAELVPW